MIDLALLEKEIDEMLSKETRESLTEWIVGKRYRKFYRSEGTCEKLEQVTSSNVVTINNSPIEQQSSGCSYLTTDSNYSYAA